MKKKTIDKFIKNLKDQIESGKSKIEFESNVLNCSNYFSSTWYKIKKEYEEGKVEDADFDNLSKLYMESVKDTGKKIVESRQASDIDEERSKTDIIEDEDGKIKEYSFDIKIKDKPSLVGRFSRDEMNMIYRLYSSYGSKLTQREVSRFFPELNLYDFRRVLRAFNITKASAQFAPHVIRENTEEQLLEMAYREKENSFLNTLEAEQGRKNSNLVKDYFSEIQRLKNNHNRLDGIVEKFFNVKLEEPRHKNKLSSSTNEKIGIFHIADLHVGAKVNPESLYENEYNVQVLRERLYNLSNKIIEGNYSKVVINLMGDMLDGMDGQTCRRDHKLPQNMNNFEQVNNFLSLMDEFFTILKGQYDSKDIFVYSVSHGNHDGVAAYTATKALFSKLEFGYGMNCTLFDKFFGHYQVGVHQFVITHGKDAEFMKRGMPFNLDHKTQVMLYDWLEENDIHGKNIHLIKGDLHNDGLSSCHKLDYRNVLSLFGSSDYAMLNFTRVNSGVSYEVIENGNLLRGTYTNL